jgi:hypothetical protein
VHTDLEEWQSKGEFEKTADYLTRVTEESRAEMIRIFQKDAINKFARAAGEYLDSIQDQADFAVLKAYDADNETFKIDLKHMGSIILNVPIDEAPYFKDSFSGAGFMDWRLAYSGGNFEIVQVFYIFAPPDDVYEKAYWVNGEAGHWIYTYANSKNYPYGSVQIDSDFDDFDINQIEATPTNRSATSDDRLLKIGPDSEINFKDSQSAFQVFSIAVIPKEIISCNGNRSDANALASYTENNILSHYSVADRRHLEAVLEEHRLQMSGLTFEETLLESGCIANAEAYLFVQSDCLMGKEMIEIRLVHCETSTLIWSCTGINATPQAVLARINEELGSKN